jgi:hypothetical protein
LSGKTRLERVTWLNNVLVLASEYKDQYAAHFGVVDQPGLLQWLEDAVEAEKNTPIKQRLGFFNASPRSDASVPDSADIDAFNKEFSWDSILVGSSEPFWGLLQLSCLEQLRIFNDNLDRDVVLDCDWEPARPRF